jgi:hypothetical protein
MRNIDWSATAAWVQAWGAVIALFVAVGIPRLQAREQRRQLREVFKNLAARAIERVDRLIAQAQRQAPSGADLSTLSLGEITGLMSRLPIDQLSADDLSTVLEFTALCRRLTDHWNQRMKRVIDLGQKCDAAPLIEAKARLCRLEASFGE